MLGERVISSRASQVVIFQLLPGGTVGINQVNWGRKGRKGVSGRENISVKAQNYKRETFENSQLSIWPVNCFKTWSDVPFRKDGSGLSVEKELKGGKARETRVCSTYIGFLYEELKHSISLFAFHNSALFSVAYLFLNLLKQH